MAMNVVAERVRALTTFRITDDMLTFIPVSKEKRATTTRMRYSNILMKSSYLKKSSTGPRTYPRQRSQTMSGILVLE